MKKPEILILHLDDEVDYLKMVRWVLFGFKHPNYNVHLLSTNSLSEAIDLVKKYEIAISMIDIIMDSPKAGFEFVEYIRDSLHNYRMIINIITGETKQIDTDLDSFLIKYKVARCIYKPEILKSTFHSIVTNGIETYLKKIGVEL